MLVFSFLRVKNTFLLQFSLVILGSILLLWAAINNTYPLVHSDTAAYVSSSFKLKVPLNDKPIGYGLFLMSARLFNSLWVPLILQSLITAALLFRIATLILPVVKRQYVIAFSAILITVLTTDISKYVSCIMPDIFTSWLFLGGFLFLISTQSVDRFFSAGAIMVSFISHNSHSFLMYSSVILLLLLSWGLRSRNDLFWKTSRQLSLLAIAATLALCMLNLAVNDRFTLTNNNSVFYISKLIYHGTLTKTLDKYCHEKNWKLCNYREVIKLNGNENFPNWYFWGEDSPMRKMGGWKPAPEDQAEYQDIISHSLNSFSPMILRRCLKETFKQLTKTSSNLFKYDETFGVFKVLRSYYPFEFNQFMNGKQQRGLEVKGRIFPLKEKIAQILFFAAAMIVLLICLSKKYYFLSGIMLALFIFLLLNAAFVGFTVAAEGRYQGRVLWLIPYFVFLVLSSLFIKLHKNVPHLIPLSMRS
ncbi:hypothetical protein L0222_01150 [bacterium]|nr:hypothetical protein [bacterium]